MKITITDTETEFDNESAWNIIRTIISYPRSVIGLSTGRTTENMHRIVAKIFESHPFDVSNVTFLGLDEIANISRKYDVTCYTMLRKQMLNALKVKNKQFIILPSISKNYSDSCQLFDKEIEKRKGIDLIMLGLGENGHLGFNQPGTSFGQTTWLTNMDKRLELQIREKTGISSDTEIGGVTLGLKNIMHARKIILLAKGKNKADIVKKMLQGKVTEDIPASILQLHPNCEFLFDKDAAQKLSL